MFEARRYASSARPRLVSVRLEPAPGEGRFAPDRAVGIRDEAQRTSEFIVVPARGLTLVEVGYPPDAELASRAEQTRAKRVTGTGLPDEGPID